MRLRNVFAVEGALSRRAAGIIQQWSEHLPGPDLLTEPAVYQEMLSKNLAYQLARQSGPAYKESNARLGAELAHLAVKAWERSGRNAAAGFLVDLLAVAEFLAREGRAESAEPPKRQGGAA